MPRPKRLRRDIVYDGRIFRVERDLVRLPSRRTVTLEVVRHRGSVVLIPQPAPDKVVLIRQYRYAIGRFIWELPAGSLEDGEPAARAARRECEEEIGLVPDRVRRLATLFPTPGFCDERMIFYHCDRLRRPTRPARRDADEDIEPRTFSVEGAWRLAAQGEIIDMKTVIGLVLMHRGRL